MKQKTAIRQLIDYLKDDIKKYEEFNNGEMNVTARLALQKAKELESVNEQQIKDACRYGISIDVGALQNAEIENYEEQYFNETFEKP